MSQKDGVRKANNNKSIKRSLISEKNKKKSIKTDENVEHIVRQREMEDSLAEAIEEGARQDSTAQTEEIQPEQVEEEERLEQIEPQERKPSFLVVLLFSGGLFCMIGALGSMVYFRLREKKGK